MSNSLQPSAKAQILTILQARSNLSSVQVTYGHPGDKRVAPECIWLGNIHGTQEARVLGAYSRLETFTVDVLIDVQKPGDDQQAATERAYELMGEVETALRADPTLDGIANFDAQVIGAIELKEFIYDKGREAELTFEIQCRGKI